MNLNDLRVGIRGENKDKSGAKTQKVEGKEMHELSPSSLLACFCYPTS